MQIVYKIRNVETGEWLKKKLWYSDHKFTKNGGRIYTRKNHATCSMNYIMNEECSNLKLEIVPFAMLECVT